MFKFFGGSQVSISPVITTKKFDKKQPPAVLTSSSGERLPALFDDSLIVGGKSLRKPRLRKSPAVRKKRVSPRKRSPKKK